MVGGFRGLAIGTLAVARRLRGTVVPRPVPGLLALTAATTAGAGLSRCSDRSCPNRFEGARNADRIDDLHGAFSVATFALWFGTPLLTAAGGRALGRGGRAASGVLGAASAAAFATTGMRRRRTMVVAAWRGSR